MDLAELPLSPHHRGFVERLVAACEADARVAAALLGGSYARGDADASSDLDLSIIVEDDAYEAFYAGRAAFLGGLGELLFLEHFGLDHLAFTIYADDTEAEIALASPGRLGQIQCGPFLALFDRRGLLEGAAFPPHTPGSDEQREELRRRIVWFWHDLSHFITAMARGQHWWAYGQLDELRRYCMNLARIKTDPEGELCGHEKVDLALSADDLAPLASTCTPLERAAMLQAGHALVCRYQELARPLAAARGLPYPAKLEGLMLGRLARLGHLPP
jgi:hypothetical protein